MAYQSNETCYARFFKVDLQVQTPEDGRNWDSADPIRLSDPRDTDDLRAKARQFLRRCYEVGLEVIGVTDHNFSARDNEEEWFLTHIIQQNRSVAEELHRQPLVIFPGFEVDIGYHLLCLFEPGTKLSVVSDRLTTLGLAPDQRFSSGRPKPLRHGGKPVSLDTVLKIVQEDSGGLVIAAHAFSTDGIADESRGAPDFRNPELLAVEVPRVPLTGRAAAIISGNDPAWHRERRVAYVMSSDCKMLSPTSGTETDRNYLGCRHTWIKMSRPSIEALRQAFLDQAHAIQEGRPEESRIRFGDARPGSQISYPWIRSIRVQGAGFLGDQYHQLSPNLTALIGGRGAGKSTMIEYLRLALGREGAIRGQEPKRHLEELKKTLGSDGLVEVEIEKDGRTWCVVFKGSGPPTVVRGEPIPDLQRFFSCQILSQGEIEAVAQNKSALLKLLDDMIAPQLAELDRQAREIIQQIRNLDVQASQEAGLEREKRGLETECLELRGKLELAKRLEEPLHAWKAKIAEDKAIKQVEDECRGLISEVRSIVEAGGFPGMRDADGAAGLIVRGFLGLAASFRERISQATRDFEEGVSSILRGTEYQRWRTDYECARTKYAQLRTELEAKGADPEAYLQYESDLEKKGRRIDEIKTRLDEIGALKEKRGKWLASLREVWKKEYEARRDLAERLSSAISLTETGNPFVGVSVKQFGDERAFAERMAGLIKDHRKLNEDDLGRFSENEHRITPDSSLLAQVVAHTAMGVSAVETFLGWVERLRAGERPEGFPWGVDARQTKVLLEWVTPEKEAELSLWRQPDHITVELYRQDGSLAGELEQGLSAGQRSTAILALLLAQDTDPVIIDQPESDLDNEFVFRQLVPLLRRAKEKRQIVVATHNANIPVNADAELVIALQARDGRGKVVEFNGEPAIGALDREAVRLAAEEILEGSEEAFRRRYEKYGF